MRSERDGNLCDSVTAFFSLCDELLGEAVGPPKTTLQSEANVLVEPAPEEDFVNLHSLNDRLAEC